MHKPSLAAAVAVLLAFSVPALAEAPGGGAPGSSGAPGSTGAPGGGAPGGGAPGAASSSAPSATPAPAADTAHGMPDGGQIPPEKFAEMKTQIAKRIDGIIAELEKRKGCITSAANIEALRACGGLPGGPGGPGHRGMMPPPGGAQPEGEQKK